MSVFIFFINQQLFLFLLTWLFRLFSDLSLVFMTLRSTVSCQGEKYTASESHGGDTASKGWIALKGENVCLINPSGGNVCSLVNLPICPDSFHFLLSLSPASLDSTALTSAETSVCVGFPPLPFLLLFQLYLFVKLYPLKLNEQLTMKLQGKTQSEQDGLCFFFVPLQHYFWVPW